MQAGVTRLIRPSPCPPAALPSKQMPAPCLILLAGTYVVDGRLHVRRTCLGGGRPGVAGRRPPARQCRHAPPGRARARRRQPSQAASSPSRPIHVPPFPGAPGKQCSGGGGAGGGHSQADRPRDLRKGMNEKGWPRGWAWEGLGGRAGRHPPNWNFSNSPFSRFQPPKSCLRLQVHQHGR